MPFEAKKGKVNYIDTMMKENKKMSMASPFRDKKENDDLTNEMNNYKITVQGNTNVKCPLCGSTNEKEIIIQEISNEEYKCLRCFTKFM